MKVTTNMHLSKRFGVFFLQRKNCEMSDFQILESLFSLTQNNATGRNASNNFLKEFCFALKSWPALRIKMKMVFVQFLDFFFKLVDKFLLEKISRFHFYY
jgi:hypothetical protein